jgi:hypothetical protein
MSFAGKAGRREVLACIILSPSRLTALAPSRLFKFLITKKRQLFIKLLLNQNKMKTAYSIAIILLSGILLSAPAQSQATSSKNDTEKLKKLEYEWLMAEFKLDTATIAAMMDNTFIAIGPAGIGNKQQELTGIYENMSDRLKNNHVVDSLYLDDVRIKIYDNTAIITFVSVTKGRIKEVPFANRRTRMYDVWIKRNGQWKAVSSQVTPLH